MTRLRWLRLQAKFALLGAALVLVGVGATALAAWWLIERQVERTARERLDHAVEFVVGEYENLLENARITGEVVAARLSLQPALSAEDVAALSAVVRNAVRTGSGDTISVIGPGGTVLVEVARDRGPAPGGNWPGDEAVATALAGQPVQGVELFSGGGLRAVAVLPMRAGGPGGSGAAGGGAVAVTSLLEHAFAARLARVTGFDVTFYAAARPVATSRTARGDAPAAPTQVWSRVAATGDAVERVEQLHRGAPGRALVRYAPLRDTAGEVIGMVAVGAPVAILSEQRLQALAVLAGVVALVLALGLAADAYAARALARPLTHLAASVQRIGGGDLAGPVPATARPDEVGTLAQAIEDMRRRLAEHAESQEQLNRLKDQYLFAVAHELRSPLAALAASAELLADEHAAMPPAERERFVGIVRRHTAGLQALVENLLDLGSLRAGRFRVHPQPTPLGPVLHEAAATVEPLLRHRRQRVEVAVAAPEPVALVDPRRLQQVLVNLLSNASKYGPEGDAIRLAAAPRDGAVHIEVADRGPGIPPEEQAQLFEAYFRSATASRAVPGVGLGLAIVKAIVDAHGGEVGVESALGQATRFWLRVPAAAPPQPPQPSDSPGPAVPAHEPGGRPNAQSAARTVAVDA